MPDPEQEPRMPDRPTYSAQDVRQGQIILRKRWQRVVFFGGLAGLVLLPLVLRLAAGG